MRFESIGEESLDALEFLELIEEEKLVKIREDHHRRAEFGLFRERRNGMRFFQMAMLEPKMAILDETDSGLDIDALRIVADGVNALQPRAGLLGDYPLSAFIGIYCAGFCARVGERSNR